jgi:hypothetical protein
MFDHPSPGYANVPTSLPVTVKINEWMASNKRTLPDETGTFNDWFELYNPTALPADLSGYRLTGNLTSTNGTWLPGGVVMPPGGFLLVWADGTSSRTWTGGALHVNFKLSKDGDTIGLFAPDGGGIDAIAFGPQQSDLSEGRWPDGTSAIYAMHPATPGSANSVLQVTELSDLGQTGGLGWLSTLGTVYELDYIDALTGTNWLPLGLVTAHSFFTTLADTNAPSLPHRFYRIRSVP